MSTSTTGAGSSPTMAQSPVQQVPMPLDIDAAEAIVAPADALISEGWSPAWESRFSQALWQLGLEPALVDEQVALLAQSGLGERELEMAFGIVAREAALTHASDAWQPGTQVGQQPPGAPSQGPFQGPPTKNPPSQGPPTQGPPSGPFPLPGPGPKPPSGKPTNPPPAGPPAGKDPSPEPDTGGPSLTPWLVGAGLLGVGVAGLVAFRTGSRNVRALSATAAAFDSGAMHQGGLQSIRDAQLGARFTGGIGTREYLSVALPGINRMGSGSKLTAVARGQLDHAELMAASTALRRGAGDGVTVHEPLRQVVLDGLEEGHSLKSLLDELDRSAQGAKPAFDNKQLARYWDRTSIMERGPLVAGHHVMSGVSAHRPALALERVMVAGPDGTRVARQIVETGDTTRLNLLVAGRGARLGHAGLADGIGTTQGVNISTLHPAMQARAIETSGVNPKLVEAIGLNGAFTQRWRDRIATGAGGVA